MKMTTEEMIQAAANLVGYFDEGSDVQRDRLARILSTAAGVATGERPLEDVLASGDIKTISKVQEMCRLSYAGYFRARDEVEWLLCQSFGMIALMCENRFQPVTGDDRKILELAAHLFAAASIRASW